MVEPTETESKKTLDYFIDTMIEINGMAHVILTVSQWDKAHEFYSRLCPFLGLTKVYDGNKMEITDVAEKSTCAGLTTIDFKVPAGGGEQYFGVEIVGPVGTDGREGMTVLKVLGGCETALGSHSRVSLSTVDGKKPDKDLKLEPQT